MPIYEYRCENGHTFEALQRMADAPLTTCEECGAPVQRVLHAPAIHFKGSGFHNTDYGTAKRSRELEKSAESGADKNDAKVAEKKSGGETSGASASSNGSKSGDGGGSSGSSSGSGSASSGSSSSD